MGWSSTLFGWPILIKFEDIGIPRMQNIFFHIQAFLKNCCVKGMNCVKVLKSVLKPFCNLFEVVLSTICEIMTET